MYMELLDDCDQGEDVQPTLTRDEILGKINKVTSAWSSCPRSEKLYQKTVPSMKPTTIPA